jgi:putative heme-binding domain-containing protein
LPRVNSTNDKLNAALLALSASSAAPPHLRVEAMSVAALGLKSLSSAQFDLLVGSLSDDTPVSVRASAVDALASAPLSQTQLARLCQAMETAGPLEINRLLPAFRKSTDDNLGRSLLAALDKASSRASLRIDLLREALAKYGPGVQKQINDLESQLNVNAAAQRKRIETLLPQMKNGDVRRGHAVFYSAKATCSSCHRMGSAGGAVGPELTKIGEARTERDLLESILYPSLSFVRSYEPVQIITTDGRTLNGRIRDKTEKEVILATGPDQEVRLTRDEIESTEPSSVSVMPGGLDGQLTVQQLADLVAFLKNPTGK